MPAPRYSPHQNPVQAAELRAREEARLASTLNAIWHQQRGGCAPLQQALPTDNGADTDSDGLSDFVEQRVGTDCKVQRQRRRRLAGWRRSARALRWAARHGT